MPRARRSPTTASAPSNWLVCFEVDVPDEHLHVTTFQILVRASEIEDALKQCEGRLRDLRAAGDLFQEPCTVELVHAIRLPSEVTTPVLLNYYDGIIYDVESESHASITCGAPNQGEIDVEIFGIEGKKGKPIEPFLDFGGQRFRATLSKALERGKRGTNPATWAEEPPPTPSPPRRGGRRVP